MFTPRVSLRKAAVANVKLSLAAVNFFLGIVGLIQLSRIGMYQQSIKGIKGVVEDAKKEVKETVQA
jgi:mitochondrial pyruvate carrier 2